MFGSGLPTKNVAHPNVDGFSFSLSQKEKNIVDTLNIFKSKNMYNSIHQLINPVD